MVNDRSRRRGSVLAAVVVAFGLAVGAEDDDGITASLTARQLDLLARAHRLANPVPQLFRLKGSTCS